MQLLVIFSYFTISYFRLFYHTPLLIIICYFTIGYCWLFKTILPYAINGRYFIVGYFIGGYC
jgi:hypothetical protein